ncbi:MAG: hypothetical protein ABL958_00865 [Bdellovibrionia bacterium]
MNHVLSLLLFSFSLSAAAKAGFSYPSELGHPLGRSAIEQDLIKVFEKELRDAGKVGEATEASENDSAISEKFAKKNQELFAEIEKIAQSEPATGVTKAQAQAILDKISKHPIVSEKNSLKYDTPSGQIGYCFGKAAYIHVELVRRGIGPNAVAKVFALGPLIHTGRGWDFHVATAVRAAEGGWWVIDGLEPKVMTLDQWRKNVLSWAQSLKTPLVRFYFSDATKLNPTPGNYEARVREPHYKGYFKDLGRWFSKNPAPVSEVFSRK